MNRKHNPWVALVAMLLLALTLVLTLTACGDNAEAAEPESPRFIFEKQDIEGLAERRLILITDTETGVQYLFVKSGYGGGLTKLEPAPEEVGS